MRPRQRASTNRRVRVDLMIGLTLLGVVIAAKLLSQASGIGLTSL